MDIIISNSYYDVKEVNAEASGESTKPELSEWQKAFQEVSSDYDENFIYKVGEIVEEPNFCKYRFKECARGIHFFINRQEAVDYI